MFFNSLEYLLFVPVVFLVYYFTRDRFRWVPLLLASVVFYATLMVPYLLLTFLSVMVVTYCAGILLGTKSSDRQKDFVFWGGVLLNLLALIIIKYLPFLSTNLNKCLELLPLSLRIPEQHALVSIGVSFYVFQAVSYLCDIYLGMAKPERHIGYFALYLAFFPKLLQGPIERANDLLPQLKAKFEFDYENARAGTLLFAWGLFKKVVIADRLALFVNPVFNDVHSFTGPYLLFATYYYALQIYFDFSGYTDMALGTARLFNINLTNNFNSPYLATSVADFWRRWHISFSRWILDYVFKPLQMKFRAQRNFGTAAALVITFIVCGIWHGANWTFIIWGLLHGTYMAASIYYRPLKKKIHAKLNLKDSFWVRTWQTVLTFNLVCFAWIFFRANSVQDALYVISKMFAGLGDYAVDAVSFLAGLGPQKGIFKPILLHQRPFQFLIAFTPIAITMFVYGMKTYFFQKRSFFDMPIWFRWPSYCCLVLLSIVLGQFSSGQQFIYFGF